MSTVKSHRKTAKALFSDVWLLFFPTIVAFFANNGILLDIRQVNRISISRLFKYCTGINLKDYCFEKKMDEVCLLLRNSALPTDQVLLRAGVTNETYFYRKFRELHGMTPAEYRARAKE
ncbi:MAG: helix-turn-helix transcriptional regulator [Oscillospiraceae bacterium]|nr:helix-turn-helix transcriptional regulator [Oscillospiraceae bacterium]